MSDERTLEQANKYIEQIELKNLELQADNLKHQLAGMEVMSQLFSLQGPMFVNRLTDLEKEIKIRREAKEALLKAVK